MEKLMNDAFMGGYALYVWPSFLVAALVMGGMVFFTMKALRKAEQTFARLKQTAPPEPMADA